MDLKTENKWRLKISNWLKIADIIYSTDDPELVLQVLEIEVLKYQRPEVRKRIYQRYNRLRRLKELKDLAETVKDAQETQNQRYLANMVSLSTFIKFRTVNDLEDLRALMKYELQTKKRRYILRILYGKFYSLRAIKEKTIYE